MNAPTIPMGQMYPCFFWERGYNTDADFKFQSANC
jgi:hypothetical protein